MPLYDFLAITGPDPIFDSHEPFIFWHVEWIGQVTPSLKLESKTTTANQDE
ncbi:hypothetical protein [Spartinivicinus poritis]|uniref:Uncharacterized protein n=1 Tax=Spartinivicinus poritis TaxID=2994640 RepID=A0ABT5UDD5_9GAMM|nr:hypothetical protein [Spartinivicinus sp. A2-2]MDE1464389.1 hypothetical protein [Spartinivicinus sp. A2-2]